MPFAREYGGLLANRSFGGAQVSRTFYARGQTGQQLLLGAYQALCRQIAAGTVQMFPQTEMLDVVIVDGQAKGIITRNLIDGKIERHAADAVVLATGGYGNVFYLSTNARGCNVTATYRAYKKGALFANPCFTQIHPTCIPVSGEHQSKLTFMSESLRNDGRVWVPKESKNDRQSAVGDSRKRRAIIISNANIQASAILRRATSLHARPRKFAMKAAASAPAGAGFISILPMRFAARRKQHPRDDTAIFSKFTKRSPAKMPTRCRCEFIRRSITPWAGLWVDYNLMSNIPGLFVIGEANFSDHGANRLGASALMQGLADGYFVLPYTLPNYLAGQMGKRPATDRAEFQAKPRTRCARASKNCSK